MDEASVISPTWFVDCCLEASSYDDGCRHLGFSEPEVAIFRNKDDAANTSES